MVGNTIRLGEVASIRDVSLVSKGKLFENLGKRSGLIGLIKRIIEFLRGITVIGIFKVTCHDTCMHLFWGS